MFNIVYFPKNTSAGIQLILRSFFFYYIILQAKDAFMVSNKMSACWRWKVNMGRRRTVRSPQPPMLTPR